MKKTTLLIVLIALSPALFFAQGYEIKINFKGDPDTTLYLARYFFGQSLIIDSCRHVKNGAAVFKGPAPLDKGVYIIANQKKERYIDFLVDDMQKFSIKGDFSDLINTMRSPESKENDAIFSYAKFFTAKNREYGKTVDEKVKGKSSSDSLKVIQQYQKSFGDELKKYDSDFMEKHKGTFVYDFLNLKNEKMPPDVPMASNGRPDSVYRYYYYKSHYFDGVNFKDDRILYTPFFADRVKKYFESVLVQHPDTVIKELDKMFAKCTQGSLVYNTLIGYFTYKYETDKTMSFDKGGNTNTFEKVFVHLADNYIINGRAGGVYNDETVTAIRKRIDIVRRLLPGARVADLFMIDTTHAREVLAMGFDTAQTNQGATTLYMKNAAKLGPMYTTLYEVKAKYTLLVFWSVDCGHCQTEIPKLNKNLKELNGKIDFKVYAVQTKQEFHERWRRFIIDNQLKFINVFEPVHINNLTDRFDINRTPVIYILDKDKRIKAKNVASEQVIEILNDLEASEAHPTN